MPASGCVEDDDAGSSITAEMLKRRRTRTRRGNWTRKKMTRRTIRSRVGHSRGAPAPFDGVVASAEEDSAAEAMDEVSMGSTFVSNDAETRPEALRRLRRRRLGLLAAAAPPFWLTTTPDWGMIARGHDVRAEGRRESTATTLAPSVAATARAPASWRRTRPPSPSRRPPRPPRPPRCSQRRAAAPCAGCAAAGAS